MPIQEAHSISDWSDCCDSALKTKKAGRLRKLYMAKKRKGKLSKHPSPLVLIKGSLPGRMLIPTAWVLLVAGVITLWIMGVPRLQAYATQTQYESEIEIGFVERPAWIKDEIQDSLMLTAGANLTGDPLKQEDLANVRTALLNTGWFRDIAQVRRVNPTLIQISAEFAQPYAVIRDNEGDHLVDIDGRLMPRTFPIGRSAKLTPIVGALYERPLSPGQFWQGADITAALDVLTYVTEADWHKQVVQIDISNYFDNQPLKIITDSGCKIIWGRGPNDAIPAEVTAQQKLAYLDYHFREYGHIDRGFPNRLDISGPVVTGQ